jgi:hypothetical protein
MSSDCNLRRLPEHLLQHVLRVYTSYIQRLRAKTGWMRTIPNPDCTRAGLHAAAVLMQTFEVIMHRFCTCSSVRSTLEDQGMPQYCASIMAHGHPMILISLVYQDLQSMANISGQPSDHHNTNNGSHRPLDKYHYSHQRRQPCRG